VHDEPVVRELDGARDLQEEREPVGEGQADAKGQDSGPDQNAQDEYEEA
jgi:hypothetical protein